MATVFSDGFSGSAADIDGRTPDTAGTSWAKQSFYSGGVLAIVAGGGRARGDTSGWQVYYATDDPGADDYSVGAGFYAATVAGNYPAVAARLDTAAGITGYLALYDKDLLQWELSRYNLATATPLGSYAQTLTPGQVYVANLAVSGTGATVSLAVTVDGVTRITASDTDASRVTARNRGGVANFGLATDSAGIHYDSFTLSNGAGGDTTPPTLGTRAVPSAGTTLTGVLSESCVPASGTGGFTTAGTSATVASWAISGGTNLTLTLSGTVLTGETVTLSYSRAATTDDVADLATNYLADFSGAAVTNNSTQYTPLSAGTASFVASGPGGITVSATAPSNGSGSGPTYQWERNADGGSYSDLAGATSLTPAADATAASGHLYGYRCKQTKGTDTVTTNAVTAQVYSGGALSGGGISRGRLVTPARGSA